MTVNLINLKYSIKFIFYSITHIQKDAIYINSNTVNITRNNFDTLEENWLSLNNWEKLIMKSNRIGSFGKLQLLHKANKNSQCHFEENIIHTPQKQSFDIDCIFRENAINILCRCSTEWLENLSSHDLRTETYCAIEGTLARCFNNTILRIDKYMNEICSDQKTALNCSDNQNLIKVNGQFITPQQQEQEKNKIWTYVMLSVFVILLFILLIVVCIMCRCYCAKKNSNNLPAPRFNPHALPHLHEFSANERMVIDKTVELTQKKYPEIHSKIKKCTNRLLQPELTNKECVKQVSKIVVLLNKINNEDGQSDFKAFNNVLTNHIQPQLPSAPPIDPIYAEPGLEGIDNNGGGFYTTSTIVPIPRNSFYAATNTQNIMGSGQGEDNNCAAGSNMPEHIYAEPNCAQQPLLRNEYASPADKRQDGAMDLYTYSDPIGVRGNVMYN